MQPGWRHDIIQSGVVASLICQFGDQRSKLAPAADKGYVFCPKGKGLFETLVICFALRGYYHKLTGVGFERRRPFCAVADYGAKVKSFRQSRQRARLGCCR